MSKRLEQVLNADLALIRERDTLKAENTQLREALERIDLTLEHSEYFGTAYETREDEAKRIARSALANLETEGE